MTVTLLAPPKAAEVALSIQVGVIFEVWLDWTNPVGATIPLATGYHARLAFSAGSTGEVVPVAVTDLTDPVTVGLITLADDSPNMTIVIPAVVTARLAFRRSRVVLDVTDGSLTTRRWAEGDVTLDRGTGF